MIKIFDGYGEITREAHSQNDIRKFLPLNENEKEYQINDGDIIQNPDYDEPGQLEKEKEKKLSEINIKTDNLISAGGDFNGDIISLSTSWLGFEGAIKGNKILLPTNITSKKGKPIEITEENSESFFDAILAKVNEIKTSEGALKIQVYMAQTFAELKVIDDTRQ